MSTLFIIESPGKLKTIREILGRDYVIKASLGHVQDLDPKSLSINIANGFEQFYLVSDGKQEIVDSLSETYHQCQDVILAQDGDAEGEQIAWSIAQLLNIPAPKRCIYNAITKSAISKAMDNLQPINMPKVKAQNARRSIDRLIGYLISPMIQKRMNNSNLACGRVMTPITRLIVERERNIQKHLASGDNFYCTITATFLDEKRQPFDAKLYELSGTAASSSTAVENDDESQEDVESGSYRMARWDDKRVIDFFNKYLSSKYIIQRLTEKETSKNPSPPFTTSTLQQFASKMMKTTPKRIMEIAQKLYEKGAITYMRTDSTMLSTEAINMCKNYITSQYGETYSQPRKWETRSATAQQAHEAIRVNYIDRLTVQEATMEENALYKIIWRQTVRSQMATARFLTQEVEIGVTGITDWMFKSSTEKCSFNGFLLLDEHPPVSEYNYTLTGEHPIELSELNGTQTSRKPPSRYDEASLVRELERNGIGRPSTVSKMIEKIQNPKCPYARIGNIEGISKETRTWSWKSGDAKYKEKRKKSKIGAEKSVLIPTDLGIELTEYLVNQFPTLFEYSYTAHMEHLLDEIMEGRTTYLDVMNQFYAVLKSALENCPGGSHILRIAENPEAAKKKQEFITTTGDGWNLSLFEGGQYGACIMGVKGEERRFAGLNGANPDDLSEEMVIQIWKDKFIGEYKGEMIEYNVGPYGGYLKWKGKNYSCKERVGLKAAIEIIKEKDNGVAAKPKVKQWRHEDADYEFVYGEGKFGPFIRVLTKKGMSSRFVSWKPEYGEVNLENVRKHVL